MMLSATLDVPAFNHIDLNQLKTQIEQQIQTGQTFLNELQHIPEPFSDKMAILNQMDHLENQLNEYWGILSHLNAVMNDEQIREIHQTILPHLSDYYTQIGQHTILYQIYQQVYDDELFQSLKQAQKSAIQLALREFKLSGVDLETEKKQRFAQISSRLSQLSSEFSNHVLDATQAYYCVLEEAQLSGLPESSVALLQQYGQQKGENCPVATLDFPAYLAVMTYADDRALREKLYYAYTTRASELGRADLDNTAIMQEILALRQELAQLVGFAHYGEYSLARKMAKDVETVEQFLMDLARHARQPAQSEMAQLIELAKEYGINELKPWDLSYFSEKLQQKQFNLSQEELRPYFPLPKVLKGLFQIVEKLYQIQIEERLASKWHDDVQYFELLQDNEVLGGFYFDLYARQGKRGGAWMSGFRSRAVLDGHLQKPICFMVGNFNPPIADQPALLTHDEVLTLFHEFGHGLHHLLTQVDDINVAGTHGVAWDAVELPSQFMEFWAWEQESLALLSEHIQTQEPLPIEILKSLIDVRHFQTGMQTLRQLEFALFDLYIHCKTPALTAEQIQQQLDTIRQNISVSPSVDYNRFQHSFSHIFAGGYACGYYSYKWAEVLASDAFDRFEQEGLFNVQTGKSFRESILAVGGEVDALTAFKNFRGREPKIDALLRHQGWTSST